MAGTRPIKPSIPSLSGILHLSKPRQSLGRTSGQRCGRCKSSTGYPSELSRTVPANEQRRKLSVLAVEAYFEPAAVIVSGEHGYAKPDPRIFRAALTALCVAPAAALYVGDSWENDVIGGLRAGLDVAWFNPNGVERPTGLPPSRGTLYEVTRLEELLVLDGLAAAT